MITDEIQIRPKYGEVDKMGYVYHANYVSYCHYARTELLRKYNIHDAQLEKNNIMMPVIAFNIEYKNAAHYDELITIKTTINEMPDVRLKFDFFLSNEKQQCICKANSTVVFVNSDTRKPIRAPHQIVQAITSSFVLL